MWAEWVEHVLIAGGLRVLHAARDGAAPAEEPPADAQLLTLVSKSNVEKEQQAGPGTEGQHALALYIADVAPLRRVSPAELQRS